jgi:hypothetical protein
VVRLKTRPDRAAAPRRGALFWMAALLAAVATLGLSAYEVFGSKTPQADDRIWISDAHRDFHGPAPAPRR